MLKILKSIESISQLRTDRVGIDDNGRVKCDGRRKFGSSKICDGEVDSNEVVDNKVRENDQQLFKSKKMVESLDIFISWTRLAFTKLR